MQYLLLKQHETHTEVAIGPIRNCTVHNRYLNIQLYETETAAAWRTMTGWEGEGVWLTTKLHQQTVSILGNEYQVAELATLPERNAQRRNWTFLFRGTPMRERIHYVWDLPPTDFESLALLSGL